MARFSAEALDIILAVVLFLVGLGYSVSGFPASIVVACIMWAIAWIFVSHLFFIFDGTDSCPVDIKLVLWGAVTFLIVIMLWGPVEVQYVKEHGVPLPIPPQTIMVQAPALPASKPRSYLVLEGSPRFQRVDANMQPTPNQDFNVGDQLVFNFFFKAVGPSAVEVYQGDGHAYLAPDTTMDAQKKIIADFRERIRTRRGLGRAIADSEASSFPPGEPARFNSAYATDDTGQPKILTQSDLDALRTGARLVYVLLEVKYKDANKIHHLRYCELLQPPAFPSRGIWGACYGFTKSD